MSSKSEKGKIGTPGKMQNGNRSGIKQSGGGKTGEKAKWGQTGVKTKSARMGKRQNVDGPTDQLTGKGHIKTHNIQYK